MNHLKKLMTGAALCATVLLTGCGGGGGDGGVSGEIIVTPPSGPAFDIEAQINGLNIGGFDVEPGESQSIAIPIGSSFAFDSNADVSWTIYVNGTAVPTGNNAIIVGNATITETTATTLDLAGYTTSQGPLPTPVQVTLLATSLYDGTQTAQINVTLTN